MTLVTAGSLPSFSPAHRDAAGNSPSTSSARSESFVHITGETTNPVVLENFVVEHPMVHSAVMFGHGRYNAGILVELEDGYKFDTRNAIQLEEMRNKLYPVIERMNMFAPQHARVQKEMVLFTAPTKPIIYSLLNTARVNRRDTLAEYSDEINVLYRTTAQAAHIALKPPQIWSPKNSLIYVRGIISAVLGKRLDDDADLFNYGIDSLQATRIRMILFHALRSSAKAETRKLSGNIVYQYRTIAGLADFASRNALKSFCHRTESNLARCLDMKKMVESHGLDFPTHRPLLPPPCDDVILITGTTGLLGSYLLEEFLRNPRVARVYALNRRKSRPGSVVERQATLLQASGLDPALARHPKLTLLETDGRRSNLGLPEELYEELLTTVTHIVHNAWLSTYDDNPPLGTFDGSFRMLRNLVDFALSSPLSLPPRLLFISSTDTLRGTSDLGSLDATPETESIGGPLAPEGPVSACDAAGGAYGESKWVGEQILAAAASATPLRPIIVRVGPLCGAANGRWREGAYFPKIVRLGVALGALPKIDELVHWIPVHTAARAVAEMRNSLSPYLHLTHPRPVSSLTLLRCISDELGLPLVSLSEWTAKLEVQVHATTKTPAPLLDATPDATAVAKTNGGALAYPKLEDDPALTLLRHLQLDPSSLSPSPSSSSSSSASSASSASSSASSLSSSSSIEAPVPPTRVFRHVVQIASDDAWFASPTLHAGVHALGPADVRLWLQHWSEVGMIPIPGGGGKGAFRRVRVRM